MSEYLIKLILRAISNIFSKIMIEISNISLTRNVFIIFDKVKIIVEMSYFEKDLNV